MTTKPNKKVYCVDCKFFHIEEDDDWEDGIESCDNLKATEIEIDTPRCRISDLKTYEEINAKNNCKFFKKLKQKDKELQEKREEEEEREKEEIEKRYTLSKIDEMESERRQNIIGFVVWVIIIFFVIGLLLKLSC